MKNNSRYNSLNIITLINLEGQVIKEKLKDNCQEIEPKTKEKLVSIYHDLAAINRQLEALACESELSFLNSKIIIDTEYIESFWGSD